MQFEAVAVFTNSEEGKEIWMKLDTTGPKPPLKQYQFINELIQYAF